MTRKQDSTNLMKEIMTPGNLQRGIPMLESTRKKRQKHRNLLQKPLVMKTKQQMKLKQQKRMKARRITLLSPALSQH